MKKILAVFIFGILWQTGCTDKNILWIAPGHEYTMSHFLVKNPSTGVIENILPSIFPFAEKVTFTKFHPLGSRGKGVIKVTNIEYYTTDHTAQATYYDTNCGCYYNDWYTYQVSWQDVQVNEYHFTWDKESQRRISFEFSEYDDIIQGTNFTSFWSLMKQDYVVHADSHDQGDAYPKVVVLQGGGVEAILQW